MVDAPDVNPIARRRRRCASRPVADRFWPKVNRDGPVPEHVPHLGPCWVWTASKTSGYGQLSMPGTKPSLAHRVSYSLHFGELPADPLIFVLHRCDNRACVRPEHLFLGTQADNMADCASKGRCGATVKPERLARGDRNGSRTKPHRIPRGERHGSRTKPEKVARGARSGAHTHPERLARGERNGAYTKPERRPRGENHGVSKLTEDRVREIFAMRAAGMKQRDIGDRFGVTQACISLILHRRNWRHVA
jgi:hypothetical protein